MRSCKDIQNIHRNVFFKNLDQIYSAGQGNERMGPVQTFGRRNQKHDHRIESDHRITKSGYARKTLATTNERYTGLIDTSPDLYLKVRF